MARVLKPRLLAKKRGVFRVHLLFGAAQARQRNRLTHSNNVICPDTTRPCLRSAHNWRRRPVVTVFPRCPLPTGKVYLRLDVLHG